MMSFSYSDKTNDFDVYSLPVEVEFRDDVDIEDIGDSAESEAAVSKTNKSWKLIVIASLAIAFATAGAVAGALLFGSDDASENNMTMEQQLQPTIVAEAQKTVKSKSSKSGRGSNGREATGGGSGSMSISMSFPFRADSNSFMSMSFPSIESNKFMLQFSYPSIDGSPDDLSSNSIADKENRRGSKGSKRGHGGSSFGGEEESGSLSMSLPSATRFLEYERYEEFDTVHDGPVFQKHF